jgi:hypothetical protein
MLIGQTGLEFQKTTAVGVSAPGILLAKERAWATIRAACGANIQASFHLGFVSFTLFPI